MARQPGADGMSAGNFHEQGVVIVSQDLQVSFPSLQSSEPSSRIEPGEYNVLAPGTITCSMGDVKPLVADTAAVLYDFGGGPMLSLQCGLDPEPGARQDEASVFAEFTFLLEDPAHEHRVAVARQIGGTGCESAGGEEQRDQSGESKTSRLHLGCLP